MPIYFAVGDKVEVPGTALGEPDGFKDSFWEATVTESSGGAQCEVQFETINETEDDDSPKLKQLVNVNKLRPLPPNDSDERLPQSRQVNDFVEVLYEGAWWLGVVCEVWHNYINVFFSSSNEIYTDIKKNDERRVRTRFEYKKNANGNFEYIPKKKTKQNRYFLNSEGERIKWNVPLTVEPIVRSPPSSSGRHEEEEQQLEEEKEQTPPPRAKPSSAKTTPKPRSGSKKRVLPKEKHGISLRHLIQYNFIAPGDDVYVLEHLESRHGTVTDDGRIIIDKNFRTTRDPAAPKEYLYHVVPKESKLRKIRRSQHWKDVYVRLSVDCGVRQLQELRDALFNGMPLPPPLAKNDAPLPLSLDNGGAAAAKGAVAGPSKGQQVKEPLTEKEEEEEESSEIEQESENEIEHHKDADLEEEAELMETEEEQEDSVLASQFFGPSEDEEEDTAVGGKKSPLAPQPHAAKKELAATKKWSAAGAAAVSRKRPASAAAEKPSQPEKRNKVAANKQIADLLKDLAEDTDTDAAPSGPTLSPLRATKKKQTIKFAFKSVVGGKKLSSSPSSSSSPSLSTSPAPHQVVAVKPLPPSATTTAALASKSSFQKHQPALPYLPSMEEKKVWCLDNVPQWVLAAALQKALIAEIPTGIINVDVPLVALDNGRFSHPGYAVIRFSTANLAEKAEPVLRQLCIRSSSCGVPRPLILRRPWLTKDYPWGKQNTLPGHLLLQVQEPPPPHYAQPNTVEFEMAVHWTQLERAISTARNTLHKEQAYELARVMSQYLLKQQHGKYHGEIDEGALHAPPPPPLPLPSSISSANPSAPRGSSFLWIRGVSPTLKVETLKEVFAQHGYPQKAEMLRDKVTRQVNGTALIQMESVDRARKVARNMQDMEFMLGGSPRPLQVEVATPGGPRGSQSVFDRALRAVVGKHDFEATTLQLIRIPEVIKETASFEDRAAGCLRELMMTHRTEQDAARQVAREARAVLAHEQKEQFSIERDKMNRLKALHDGQAYKKMCELHTLAIRRLRHSSPVHLK
ncbi:hypothetical protein Ndes2526B_g02770 [Nannochloris sp. 'desiccata']